jgi:hypothetical protein
MASNVEMDDGRNVNARADEHVVAVVVTGPQMSQRSQGR